jgi:trimethylamine--corrinoid protein Co-methyltransferase
MHNMKLQDYGLRGGLNPGQIRSMHEKAMWLIETSGIQVPHEGVRKVIAGHDGVGVEKDMVRFKPEVVLRALEAAQYDVPEYARTGWVMSAGAHQTNCYGLDTGRLRPPTTQDLIDFLKLGDALDTVGSAPVIPMDVPVHLQHILMHKLAYEHTRYRCNDIYEHMDKPSYECAMYVREMAQAANKRFAFGIWMISPKSFDMNNLEVAYRLRDLGIPMWVATMPQAGVTAPITILGTVLQSMFEIFAGLTVLHLMNPRGNNYISPADAFEANTFDMKYTTFVYGSVEYIQHSLHQMALCSHYGIPIIIKSLLTSAKEPDAHAAAEMGIHTFITALAGARAFRCGGLLSTGEVYSGEWVVILHEMIEYIKQVLKEEEWSEERLMIQDIVDVGPGGTYVDKRSTYELVRQEYWMPRLFEHSNIGQWIELGSKSIRTQAQEMARKLIAEHTYAIGKDEKKELDRIYERAKRDERLERSLKLQI